MRKRTLVATARAAAFAAAGFLGASMTLDRLRPWTGDALETAKLEVFRRDKDSYTCLFIGNSRAYRELDPIAFDAAAAKAGWASRSFNLGMPGMAVLEADSILRRVAEMRPRALKRIVMTANMGPWPEALRRNRSVDLRQLAWQDARQTSRLLFYALSRGAQPSDQADGASRALVLGRVLDVFVERFLGRGRLQGWSSGLAEWETAVAQTEERYEMSARRGYYPLELDEPDWRPNRERFLQMGRSEFERGLRDWQTTAAKGDSMPDDGVHPGFDEIRALAASQGWKVYFVGHLGEAHAPTGCERKARDCALLEFFDRRVYGRLMRYDSFWDVDHLNQENARVFSALVTQRIAEEERLAAR